MNIRLRNLFFSSVIISFLIIPGVSMAAENNLTVPFTGTVTYQDLEGGFFGIITDKGEQLLPVNLPEQYAVNGLTIQGIAIPENGTVSIQMWGNLVRLESVTPLNGGGPLEKAWYPETAEVPRVSGLEDQMNIQLLKTSATLQKELDTIDSHLANVARQLSGKDIAKENLNDTLSSLIDDSLGVYEVTIIDNSGHIISVYPELYQNVVGEDVSAQSHNSDFIAYPVPSLSEYIHTVEGKNAVILSYPIFSEQMSINGHISVLIDPFVFMRTTTESLLKNSGYSLMVLQPDGTDIYDTDQKQMGLSTWDNPIYRSSPSLLTSAVHLQNARAGYDQYSFINSGTNETVLKNIVWTTVSLHGTPWRVGVIKG